MKTIKVNHWADVLIDFTGIVEWENEVRIWLKNGSRHREDGPAYIGLSGYKQWWLNGIFIWASNLDKLDLKKKIVLSKEKHPAYPTIQILKYIDEYRIQERIIIPGMEEWFIE